MADPGVSEPSQQKFKLLFSLQKAYKQFTNFITGFMLSQLMGMAHKRMRTQAETGTIIAFLSELYF